MENVKVGVGSIGILYMFWSCGMAPATSYLSLLSDKIGRFVWLLCNEMSNEIVLYLLGGCSGG